MKIKKNGIIVCLTAIILVVSIYSKNEFARLLPTDNYGMSVAIEKEKIQHLFIGSSMFRQGLSIYELEKYLEGNTYILSYNGNQAIFIANELEYMLEHGLEVENLYIDLYPYVMVEEPKISDTKILLDTDIDFKIDCWQLLKQNSDIGFLDLYEMFVTANNEQLLIYPLHSKLVEPLFYNGGNLQQSVGVSYDSLEKISMFNPATELNEIQVEGYKKIVSLANENNIEVCFIETAKYIRVIEDSSYQNILEQCIDILDELNVRYILAEDIVFDSTNSDYFIDLIHMSYNGSKEYTNKLCEELK